VEFGLRAYVEVTEAGNGHVVHEWLRTNARRRVSRLVGGLVAPREGMCWAQSPLKSTIAAARSDDNRDELQNSSNGLLVRPDLRQVSVTFVTGRLTFLCANTFWETVRSGFFAADLSQL
jgi:hypothetical protein